MPIATYEVEAAFPVEHIAPVDPDTLDTLIPVVVPARFRGGPVKPMNLEVEFRSTVGGSSELRVRWAFECEFDPNPSNDISGETRLEESQRMNALVLPGHRNLIGLVELSLTYITDAVLLMSLNSMMPGYLLAIGDARNNRVGSATLRVEGELIEFTPNTYWAKAGVTGKTLSLAHVTAILGGEALQHERFARLADERFLEMDLGMAVVLLTTTLEVACYSKAADLGDPSDEVRFNPKDYLGRTPHGRLTNWSAQLAPPAPQLAQAESLWGTRHEIVHAGRWLVRPSGSKPPPGTTLPPLRRDDYLQFRGAVSEILSWMGYRAIQSS